MAFESVPCIDRLAFELQIDGRLLATEHIPQAQPNQGRASTKKQREFLVHSTRLIIGGGLIARCQQVTLLVSLSLVERTKEPTDEPRPTESQRDTTSKCS